MCSPFSVVPKSFRPGRQPHMYLSLKPLPFFICVDLLPFPILFPLPSNRSSVLYVFVIDPLSKRLPLLMLWHAKFVCLPSPSFLLTTVCFGGWYRLCQFFYPPFPPLSFSDKVRHNNDASILNPMSSSSCKPALDSPPCNHFLPSPFFLGFLLPGWPVRYKQQCSAT